MFGTIFYNYCLFIIIKKQESHPLNSGTKVTLKVDLGNVAEVLTRNL